MTQSRVALTKSEYDKGDLQVGWLHENLISVNASLLDDPAVLKCIELQKRLDENLTSQRAAEQEIERLTNRQERLRKNIKTGSSDQQNLRWLTDLGQAEDGIVALEDSKLPELKSEHDIFADNFLKP